VNGALAAPVMEILMVLIRRQKVMGWLVVTGPLCWLGWASTIAMAFGIVGMAATIFMGRRHRQARVRTHQT
jgi:hypothetical protein